MRHFGGIGVYLCHSHILVGISTHVQSDVSFAIGIWDRKGGSGGGVPLDLSGGTIFLARHTGFSP